MASHEKVMKSDAKEQRGTLSLVFRATPLRNPNIDNWLWQKLSN